MDLQKNRFEIFNLVNAVRFRFENFYAARMNEQCGEKYRGKFDFNLTNPKKATERVLHCFCTNGLVLFHPDEGGQHEALKEFRTTDGAINLSKLHATEECPDHIQAEEWAMYRNMLKDIFAVLHSHGIGPMHQLVCDTQRSLGYGGLKIHKNFGGDGDAEEKTSYSVIEVMKKWIEDFDTKHKQAA